MEMEAVPCSVERSEALLWFNLKRFSLIVAKTSENVSTDAAPRKNWKLFLFVSMPRFWRIKSRFV